MEKKDYDMNKKRESGLISIVIPVYSAGKKLNRCIESLLAQTYSNLQIVIVDDKSPDKLTLEVEDYWKGQDKRIELYRNEINGTPEPRFRGIQMSKGEYICFSDQDDWFPVDSLEKMYGTAKDLGVDVVVGQVSKALKLGPLVKTFPNKRKTVPIGKLILKDDLMEQYFVSYFGYNILPVSVWGKLYKSSVFDVAENDLLKASKIKAGAGDIVMSMTLHPYVNSMYIIKDVVYTYFIGMPGISPKYLKTWLPLSCNLFTYKWELLDKYNYDKGRKLLAIEMVNYIKSYVKTCVTFSSRNRLLHIKTLKDALNHKVWRNVEMLIGTDYYDQEIVSLILGNNADVIYLKEEGCVLHNSSLIEKLKRLLLRMTSHLKS